MNHVKAILILLFAALAFTVAVQNYNETCLIAPVVFRVTLPLIQYKSEAIPLGALAIACFMVGVILMGLYGILERLRLRKQVRVLQAEAKQKDREINSLKNLAEETKRDLVETSGHVDLDQFSDMEKEN